MIGPHGRGGVALGRGGRRIKRGGPGPGIDPTTVPPPSIGRALGIVAPNFIASRVTTLKTAQPLFQIIRNPINAPGTQSTEASTPSFGALNARAVLGLTSVVAVFQSHAWNRKTMTDRAGFGPWSPPADLTKWGVWVTALANWVKTNLPGIHWWEIWNEPNHEPFWPNPTAGGPEWYARMLRTAYKAIKDVDPLAIVCTGGLSPEKMVSPNGGLKSWVWFDRMLTELEALKASYVKPAAGWHEWAAFDRIGMHPYMGNRLGDNTIGNVYNNTPHGPPPNFSTNTFAYEMPQMAQVAADHGLPKLPIWATEMGVYHSPNATTGEGWNGGPFGAKNDDVASEPEAYDWWNDTLRAWFGSWNGVSQPFPSGSNLINWPAGWGLPTEMLLAFHLQDFAVGDTDLHGGISGFWDKDGVLKRQTPGGANDAYEAFTGFTP